MPDSPYDLGNEAKRIVQIVRRQARRPYVLEITGTPKAGKTSAIAMLEAFFKTCGWRVHVGRERAALCPLPMKGHFFFNTWTLCTMLSEVLDVAESDRDLVILDRGFFDALIWLELQALRKQVSPEERRAFESFVLLDRWRRLVDLTVVMRVEPAVAMEREQVDRLLPREGSVMNEATLSVFNGAVGGAIERHGGEFSLIDFDAGLKDRKETAAGLISQVLPAMDGWADPSIAAAELAAVRSVFAERHAIAWTEIEANWTTIVRATAMHRRSGAESDDTLVQLVAVGALTYRGRVFVFDRSADPERRANYGRRTILRLCHVDQGDGTDLVAHARACLVDRLRQDLHLELAIDPRLLGVIWHDDRSRQHMGMVFEVPIDDEIVAESLKEKEFKTRGRGHRMTSSFAEASLIAEHADDLELEVWSRDILQEGWIA